MNKFFSLGSIVAAQTSRFLAEEEAQQVLIPGCAQYGQEEMSDSCELCQASLYLYRTQSGSDASVFKNICVFDCQAANINTAPDDARMQCVYVGPGCKEAGLITPATEDDNQVKPLGCKASVLTDQGYVISSRANIQSFLNETEELGLEETVPTFEERKQQAFLYTEPVQMISGSSPANSNSAKSVTKCFGKKCSTCSETKLNECDTCSTYFSVNDDGPGECKQSNFCTEDAEDTSTCCNIHNNYRYGCVAADSSCSWCGVCMPEYTFYHTLSTCLPCDDRANCESCIHEKKSGHTITCQICESGYGIDSNGNCIECSLPNIRNCRFEADGTELPQTCSEPYTLSADKKWCVLGCEVGYFQNVNYNSDVSAVINFYCDQCNEACDTCSGPDATDCLTCKAGKYINSEGACTAKAGELTTKKLLVLNADNKGKADSIDQSTDKTIAHSNLLEAIFQAYADSTQYETASVEILMEKGTHYILPSYTEEFNAKKLEGKTVDFKNSRLSLVIKPLSCSDTSIPDINYNDLSSTCSNDNEKGTVFIRNKAKSQFELPVPFKLRVEDLVFEGIDSTGAELHDAEGYDFYWKDGSHYPEPTSSRTRASFDENPICKQRSHSSLFQFIVPNRDITDLDQAQSLEIADCTFQNFFYELGSIVRLPERTPAVPWKLSITGSTFNRMSFCGSIVANEFPRFASDDDSESTKIFKTSLEQVIQKKFVFEASSSLDCSAVNCQQFTFSQNTVKNLFMFKTLESQPYLTDRVDPAMSPFGIVVHLVGFASAVTISGNTIQSIGMKFEGICTTEGEGDYFKYSPVLNTEKEPWYERWTSETLIERDTHMVPHNATSATLQSQSLIIVETTNKQVTIKSNAVSNVVTSGTLIQVSQSGFGADADPSAFSFNSNSFTSVGSYLGTPVLTFTRQDETSTATEQNSRCLANAEILSSTFNKVATSCLGDTGLLRIQCNNTKLASEEQDTFDLIRKTAFIPEHTLDETKMDALVSTPPTLKIEQNTIINSALAQAQQVEIGAFIFISGGFKLQAQANSITNLYPSNHRASFLAYSPFATYLGWEVSSGSDDEAVQLPTTSGPVWYVEYPSIISIKTDKLLESNIAGHSSSLGGFVHLKANYKEAVFSNIEVTSVSGISSPLLQLEVLSSQPAYSSSLQLLSTKISKLTLSAEGSMLSFEELKSYRQLPLLLKADTNEKLDTFTATAITASSIGIQDNTQTSTSADFLIKHPARSMIGSLLNIKAQACTLSEFTVSDMDLTSNFGEVAFEPTAYQTSTFTGSRVLQFGDNSYSEVDNFEFLFQTQSFFNLYIMALNQKQEITLADSEFEDLYFGSIVSIKDPPEDEADLAQLAAALASNQSLLGIQMPGVTEGDVEVKNLNLTRVASTQFRNLSTELPKTINFQVVKPSLISVVDGAVSSSESTLKIDNCNLNSHLGAIQSGLQASEASALPVSSELVNSGLRFQRITFSNNKYLGAQDALDSAGRLASLQTFRCFDGVPKFYLTNSEFSSTNDDILSQEDFTTNEQTLRDRLAKEDTNVRRYKNLISFLNCVTSSTDTPSVTIKDLEFKNLKIVNADSSSEKTFLAAGSLISLLNTEVTIEDFKATNIVSEANGAVFSVSDSQSGSVDSFTLTDSEFESVSSYRNGSVISYSSVLMELPEGFVKMSVESSSFKSNRANFSAGISYESTNTQLKMKKLTIEENVALQSGSFAILKGSLDYDKTKLPGYEVKFNEPNSAIILDDSDLLKNEAVNGSAVIILIDKSIVITKTNFIDNKAGSGTNGIWLSRQDTNVITQGMNVDASKFQTTDDVTLNSEGIFGGYIHVSDNLLGTNMPTSTNPAAYSTKKYLQLEVNIIILDSEFISGKAQHGGAIFVSQEKYYILQDSELTIIHTYLEFYIFDSKFNENTADRGGSLYFDHLDHHIVVIQGDSSKVSFSSNKANQIGDAIFAEQTSRTQVETKNSRRRILQSSSQRDSQFMIHNTVFDNAEGTTQVFLSTLENVEIQSAEFSENKDSQALEGGSLHLVDCLKVMITQNTFTKQASIIKGGAIFIRQKSDLFFGDDIYGHGDNVLTLKDNTFTGCSSQQGGSIFISRVKVTRFTNTNRIEGSVAKFYTQVEPFLGNYDSLSVITNQLEVDLMSFPLNYIKGRGPAMYFEYSSKQEDVELIIPETTVLEDNKIQQIEENGEASYLPEEPNQKIFFESLFPQDNIASKFKEHCLFLKPIDALGSDVVIFSSQIEYNDFKQQLDLALETIGQQTLNLQYQVKNSIAIGASSEEFAELFSISKFDHSSMALFGSANPLAIIDDEGTVQIHDFSSTFTIEIIDIEDEDLEKPEDNGDGDDDDKEEDDKEDDSEDDEGDRRRRLQGSSKIEQAMFFGTETASKFRTYSWTASYGQFTLPSVKFFTEPGSKIQLRFSFTLFQTEAAPLSITREAILKTIACDKGDILTDDGFCIPCQGPNLYLTKFDDPEILKVYENKNVCHLCNKDVFQCNSEQDIVALENFQLVLKDSDIFAKCPTLKEAPLCTGSNECRPGYRGLLCQQCASGHFREYDGSCQSCTSMYSYFVILSKIFAVGAIFIISRIYVKSQTKAQISPWVFYFKNLATFILYFGLIAQVTQWVDVEEDAAFGRQLLRWMVIAINFLFKMPIAGSESLQCFMEQVDDENSTYSPAAYSQLEDKDYLIPNVDGLDQTTLLRIYTLAMGSGLILMGGIIFFIKDYDHNPEEFEKLQHELKEIEANEVVQLNPEDLRAAAIEVGPSEEELAHPPILIEKVRSSVVIEPTERLAPSLQLLRPEEEKETEPAQEQPQAESLVNDANPAPLIEKVRIAPSPEAERPEEEEKVATVQQEEEAKGQPPKADSPEPKIPEPSQSKPSEAPEATKEEKQEVAPKFETVKEAEAERPAENDGKEVQMEGGEEEEEKKVPQSLQQQQSSARKISSQGSGASPSKRAKYAKKNTVKSKIQALAKSISIRNTSPQKSEQDPQGGLSPMSISFYQKPKNPRLQQVGLNILQGPIENTERSTFFHHDLERHGDFENQMSFPQKQESDGSGSRTASPKPSMSFQEHIQPNVKITDGRGVNREDHEAGAVSSHPPKGGFASRDELISKTLLMKSPSDEQLELHNLSAGEDQKQFFTTRMSMNKTFQKRKNSQAPLVGSQEANTDEPDPKDDLVVFSPNITRDSHEFRATDESFALKAELTRVGERRQMPELSKQEIIPQKDRPSSASVNHRPALISKIQQQSNPDEQGTLKTSSNNRPKDPPSDKDSSNSQQGLIINSKCPSKRGSHSKISVDEGKLIQNHSSDLDDDEDIKKIFVLNNNIEENKEDQPDAPGKLAESSHEDSDFDEESEEGLEPTERPRFEYYRVVFILTWFVFGTQVANLVLAQYSCREYSYLGYHDESLFALVEPRLPVKRNYFDSSLSCFPEDFYLIPNACFIGLWVSLTFRFLVYSKNKTIQIEASGQIIRLLIILVSKGYLLSEQDSTCKIVGVLVACQCLVFWILRKKQAASLQEEVLQVKWINPLDLCMHLVILGAAIIAILQRFSIPTIIKDSSCYLVCTLISIYLLMFLWYVAKLIRKDMFRNKTSLLVFLTMTCQRSRKAEFIKQVNLRKQQERDRLIKAVAKLKEERAALERS